MRKKSRTPGLYHWPTQHLASSHTGPDTLRQLLDTTTPCSYSFLRSYLNFPVFITVVSAGKDSLRTLHKLRSILYRNVFYQSQHIAVPFTAPAVTKMLTNSHHAKKVKWWHFLLGLLQRHGIAMLLTCIQTDIFFTFSQFLSHFSNIFWLASCARHNVSVLPWILL